MVSSLILAPICEELLYRGVVVRPVHDDLVRRGLGRWLSAGVAVTLGAVLFALPHLGESLTGRDAVAYLVTGLAFGVVYVLTGSMTATMVSHALQSWASFGQVLLFGRGDSEVSPIVWVIVLGCPLWVYLGALALRLVFRDGEAGLRAGR